MIKLWGLLRDVLRGGQGFTGYFRQQLSGVALLDTSRMTDQNNYQYVQKINHIKPSLILAFPNSIEELTSFIHDHHLSVYSPRAIMTSGSVLFPEVRTRIKEVFHSIIFDRYGSREVGDIACNCAKSEGLHLLPDIHYLEIIDDEGKEAKCGEAGSIIITLLTNYTMPLIRYQIGDLGILSDNNIHCGHELPLLEKVVGRIKSRFKNKFGEYISGGFYPPLFYFKENIQQFQIIQETADLILINLVLIDKDKLKDMKNDFQEINQKIEKIMRHKTAIQYNIVDEIKPSPSGKYLYVFSKI